MKKSVNRSSRGGFTLIEIVVSTVPSWQLSVQGF